MLCLLVYASGDVGIHFATVSVDAIGLGMEDGHIKSRPQCQLQTASDPEKRDHRVT